MDRDRDNNEAAVNSFVDSERQDSDNDSEMATFVSGFAGEEQRRTDNRKRSLTELDRVNDDLMDKLHRIEPINLTTEVEDRNSNNNVEGPADHSAGTRRSQYHSIQQLSQSGRPADRCGLFPSVEATVYGQAWLGCGGYPVEVAGEGEEDTLHVLRTLLRRYDSCTERGMAAAEVFDGRGNESDEIASGRASNSDLHGDSQSDDDFEENQSPLGQQMTLKRSPSTNILQAKRARVEHIVSNIRTPTYTEDAGGIGAGGSGGSTSVEVTIVDGGRRSKRKQTVPQQHDSATFDNEDHHSVNGNLSDGGGDDDDDDDDDNDDDDDDDDDDVNQAELSREQPGDDEGELRQQLRAVQLRLEDMYTKYAKSLHTDDIHLSASRSPDDDSYLASDSKVNDEAERLTSLLKAEFRHLVDGLVDRLIQQFLTKHYANRHRAPQSSPSTEDRPRLDFPRLSPAASLPVFPPMFSPLPFPVGGEMLALRRAYAERCAYVDVLVQQARTARATDQDDVTLNYNNSTSGPVPCTLVTSPSTDTVDRCSLMSVNSSRCLLSDQQFLPSQTQDTFVTATSSSTGNSGVQKKKRTKVTDTRLSPRVARALLQDGFYHRSRTSHDIVARKQPHRTPLPPTAADLPMRQAINTSSVGSAFYGHHMQQQQQQQQQQQPADNLLHRHHHHHHHHHQYQQRLSTVRDTFLAGCPGDSADAIPQFDAGRRQMTDPGVLGTSLHRTQQRQPGTGFVMSRSVAELPDRACVDRYDYVLLGCDQFQKISY